MVDLNAAFQAKEVYTPSSRELIDTDQESDKVDYQDQYHDHLRGSRVSRSGDHGFTKNDRTDMRRMGKQQELRRDFRALSALAFTVILQGR
jgi:choline transport protein